MLDELKKIGTFLVAEITNDLVRSEKKVSGKLIKSFRSEVNGLSDGYEIAVIAESYFKFVDQGVNGVGPATRYSIKGRQTGSQYSYKSKKPPLEPILEWVKQRGLAKGNQTVKSAAFAIQTAIWRNGTKGINILEGILKTASTEYVDKIGNAMFTKVSTQIDTIIKNGNLNK